MGLQIWNLLGTELYTNQLLIHVSAFSSRFWWAVIPEYNDCLQYYISSSILPWVGLGEACGWVVCYSVAAYDQMSKVIGPV